MAYVSELGEAMNALETAKGHPDAVIVSRKELWQLLCSIERVAVETRVNTEAVRTALALRKYVTDKGTRDYPHLKHCLTDFISDLGGEN